MDHLSNQDRFTSQLRSSSGNGALQEGKLFSAQTIFPGSYLPSHDDSSKRQFYPTSEKDKKDPLAIPYHQKVAFAMTVLSLASSCLGGRNASLIGYTGMAFQVGLSLFNFSQNPSISNGMPIGMMALQTALSFTPINSALPYLNLLLQGRSTYAMSKDCWNQIGLSLQNLTQDNYAIVGRNLFVYGINALSSGYNLYRGYQNTYTIKETASEPSPADIENAKQTLCKGLGKCPTDWTPKEIKRLYRKQSLSAHPDKTGSDEAFNALTKARDILLSIFKAPPVKQEATAEASSPEPTVETSSSFGLQQIQESISSWGDSFWGFFNAFDKYLSLPVAGASEASERTFSLGPVLNNRALAHVLGDPYIGGTNLEGSNLQSTMKTLVDLSADASADLRREITALAEKIQYIPVEPMTSSGRHSLALKIADQVQKLNPGEDLWMEGGWRVKRGIGHSMLYQWIKRQDGDYDIYIYNTGAGLEYHDQEIKKEVLSPAQSLDPTILGASSSKKNVLPYVKFKGVPGSVMGFLDTPEKPPSLFEGLLGAKVPENNPVLFEKLIEVKAGIDENEPEKQIYLEIFGTLNDYRDVDGDEGDFLVPPQISGTCSWYVLVFAALRKYLKNIDNLEKVDFERDEKAFESSCSSYTSDPTKRELCIRGGHKLLLDLAKLHENGIRHEEVENKREKIQDALDLLSYEGESTCSFSEELEIISSRNNPYSMLAKRFPSHVWNGWEPNVLSSGVTSQTTPFSSHFLDVQQIDNLIKESNRILTFSGGSTHDIPMRIEQLVKRLPRPSQFHTAWKGASPDQIRTSIEVLSNVLTKYTSDVLAKPGRLLTEQNTAWALLATIHHLSTRLNDDLQSKYGIHHATFTQLIQDPFFTNFRREDVEFYQEIASYFKSLPQDLLLFDQSKSLSVIRESDIQNRISDEVFLEDIEQKHTKIAQQIQVEISKMEENYPSIPTWMIKRLIYRTKNDIFANHQETSFISSLRMAVYSAAAYNSYLYTSPNFSKYPIHLHSITDTDKSINFSSDWSLSSMGGMKYLMPDKYAFSNLDVSSHCLFNVDSNLKENLAVSPKLFVRNEEIDSALDVTGCQKTLQSQLLVDYAKDNIETLSDEIMQNTMLLQLFKTYPSGTPIHEDMKNPHFIVSVSELIEKGLSKFWKNRLSPDIKTTLFFLQIARRIKELDPQVSLRDFSSDINQLLKLDMKNEERIALHMHRILQYTTQKDALCALEKSETAENVALKEILTSWMYVSSHKFEGWHHFHSQSEVVHFIHDLAPIFENLSEDFLHALISDLMPSHNAPFTVVAKPYPELATYLAQDLNGETWSINPLHGKIYRGKEPFQIGLQKDFSANQAYKTLFGDQKFKLIKEGAAFVFQDSHQNTFRIFENGTNIIIQMQFEGEWYQHVTKENGLTKAQLNLLLESVPKAMLSDHFVFRSKDKTLFVHKNTFSIDFIDFQGTSQGGKSALFEHEYLYPWTEDFEKKSWILERVYEDGNFHIEFPRFVSTNGRTLEFEGKFGQIFWKENPTFALAKMMPGFLGLCSNYLLLHDGEKSKLLVPVKPVLPTSKEFKPHCVLDIGDEARLREYANNENSGPYTGELNSPQLKQHHFIEYDIEDGQAKPLNLEGALFLAYLFLAQKSYSQALKILKEDLNIKAHLTHTPLSKKIILQIVTHPILSYDQSANSIAFALKALLLLPKEEWPDNSQGLWIQYQNGLNGVQADLRLSTQDRNQFIKRYGEQNQEISSQETRWNWRIQNGMNKYDMASLMRFDNGSIIKFIEVYNAFHQAKTREEKIFLRLKYLDYLKKGSYYLPAIKAVVEGDGSKFLPYPTQKVSRDEHAKWLEQFEEADDIILVSPRSVRSKKTTRTASQGRTLADSLYKIKAHHPQEPFALGSIDLVENGFVNNLMQTSFLEETTPTRQSYLDEARLFNQPIPELYESAVAKERADFIHEYNEGMRKNQEEKQFSLQAGETLEQVHKKITAYLKDLNPQALKHEILKLVNRLPDDEQQRTLTLLLEGGQSKSKVRMHETINCFLEGKSEGYLALNSHLTEEEIRRLDHLVQEFLVVSIEAAYMEKALKINNPQELGLHLSQGTEYISSEYDSLKRQFLVYEYRAGLRMRREQVALILKMAEKKSCVTQLMMGGGKTSVLASNLLYLSAKPGRISFFIPPAAQFSTLKENLGNMQKRHFHQEVVPIQIKRDQLDEENLKWIKEQFLAAKTSRKVILTTRESVESIVLEYLDLLGKGNADDEKLQLLSFLVKEMKEFGDVLVDEVDLILNPMQETNFPFGSKVSIEPQLIDMTRQLFTLLSSSKFEEKIRLRSNQQAVLTERESREILSEVLKEFFDERKELDLEPSEKAAFLEFISGKETGRSFRQLLELKAQSKKLRASAEEISLLKHLSSDIFPLTLSKSTGEGYGRVLEDISVGPYHGVNSPSFTEFGSQWEAMAYHFQTVLSKGVTRKQLQDLYKHFFKSAGFTSELTGTMLEETWEAKAFQKLTGYSFAEFPTHEQEALDVVNQDSKTQLYIEANSIANLVGYYTKYFRSTSQNFAASFSGFDSFSGTPWNPESFPRDLEENFHPDVGTEGKIIDEFLERAQKKSLEVFTTTSIKPKETLAQVLSAMKSKRRSRVLGFIDSGGLFKENTGLSVAQEILDFYAKDERIESVLFFDRPDPLSPMVLMALKKGDPTPIIIGSTQPKEIAKHGLKLYSTFVYYDQTHCEATDILQKSDAINLISVNHRTIRRTLTQGILRLRGYFKGQDVEVVIPKEEQAHFTADGSSPTHQDILLKTIDNQAVRKADQTFRSYRQKVDHALREIVMEKLRAGNSIQEEIAIFERFQDVLISTKEHDLYAQFGSPEVSIDSLEALIEYCDQKKILFKRLANEDSATYRKAERMLSQIIESAGKSPYRPSRVKRSLKTDAGTEVETAQEAEVKEEIDHSILTELESYQTGRSFHLFREPVWTLAEVNKGFEKREYTNLQFFKKDSSNVLFALRDVLSDQTLVKYRRDFSSLFTDRFLVSRNFLRRDEHGFSNIFDKNCKPGRQVLIVKEKGQFKAILISTAEADFFKNYIKDNSPENIWLLLPDGRPFVGEAPEMTPDLKDLLWQANLFNGNVKGLLAHEMTPKKRKKLDPKLLHDFLLYKSRTPEQRDLLESHFVEKKQVGGKEKDPLSTFRPMTNLEEEDSLEDYSALIGLGISQKDLQGKNKHVKEALLKHIEAIRRLHDNEVDISSILNLSTSDLIKVLENVDSLIVMLWKGVTLPTFLKIITSSKKSKSTLGDKK